MVKQYNSPMTDADHVDNIVHLALNPLRSKELPLRELLHQMTDNIIKACNEHFSTKDFFAETEIPESGVNREWEWRVTSAGKAFKVLMNAESILCNADNRWTGDVSLTKIKARVEAILQEYRLTGAATLEEYTAKVNRTLALELNSATFSFIGVGSTWTVYAVAAGNVAVLIGSWDLTGYVPEFFEAGEAPKLTSGDMATSGALLSKIGSIFADLPVGPTRVADSADSLFKSIKAYLRLLHKHYATVPFKYDVFWTVDTRQSGAAMKRFLPALPVYMAAEGYLQEVRKAIPPADWNAVEERMHPYNVATHVTVNITVANKRDQFIIPIPQLERHSRFAACNTTEVNEDFWQLVKEEVKVVEESAEEPDAVYSQINQNVQALGSFAAPQTTGDALRKALHHMWTEVGRLHGIPGVTRKFPRRAITALMTDYAAWLDNFGRQYVEQGDNFSGSAYLTEFAVEYVLREWANGRSEALLFTMADFMPYISAGLDWHPSADTFFIPSVG